MNADKINLDELRNHYEELGALLLPAEYSRDNREYPLDNEVRGKIAEIVLNDQDNDFKIFNYLDKVKQLWPLLIRKSILCLRYFDGREPFMEKGEKSPHAYGVRELSDYFDQYTEFEKTLYGSAKYYRDHVMHVFRVWVLGLNILFRNNGYYLRNVQIAEGYDINNYEKLSLWTIIALTHDLGYPLEKASQVIEKTKNMMKAFVTNPSVDMDVTFSGVQNSMNDFVLRFISSKMWEIDPESRKTLEHTRESAEAEMRTRAEHAANGTLAEYLKEKRYVARLQPKYYFKFQKSLEHNEHGVLSALIIYKVLLYFLESDYSLNEDYMFDYEDTRQFYLRREILRSMASHTCKDIYQNDALRFSFLLILCDDAQDWGRKNITQLYVDNQLGYEFGNVLISEGQPIQSSISDSYDVTSKETLKQLVDNYKEQCKSYRSLFRDGQDTSNRNFEFKRILTMKSTVGGGGRTDYNLTLEVSTDRQTKVVVKKVDGTALNPEDTFITTIKEIFKNEKEEQGPENRFLTFMIS